MVFRSFLQNRHEQSLTGVICEFLKEMIGRGAVTFLLEDAIYLASELPKVFVVPAAYFAVRVIVPYEESTHAIYP